MLFQRLYNWIKYKTLPPSFLFKNRLFIERDSKNKRIFNNFGLTFKSSKWSNYQNYNIKINFKNNNFFFFLIVLILFIFIINYQNYYIKFYLFNNISFLFWISFDSFDYYLSYLIWITTTAFTVFINTIYSYLFFNNLWFANKSKNEFSLINFKKNNNKDNIFFNKNDLNWFSYLWLINNKNNTKLINHSLILENFFSNHINNNLWKNYYDFFIKLYRLTFLLKINNEKNNNFFLNNKIKNITHTANSLIEKNFLFYLFNNNQLNNYSSIIFYYLLNSYKKNNINLNLTSSKNNWNWNLYTMNNELKKNNQLVSIKNGFFFFNTLSQNQLSNLLINNSEFNSLNNFTINQIKTSKINRWLYKYSILHRKLLKNSHKLTLHKKILNLNFYSKNDFNKNLWNSQHLTKLSKKNEKDFFNLIFLNSFLNLNFLTNNYTNKNSHSSFIFKNLNNNFLFKNLNFYENSYFWFIKRFYLFNTLPSNFIKIKKTQSNFQFKSTFLLNSSNLNLNNYLLNSEVFALNDFNLFSFNSNFLNLNTFLNNKETKKITNDFFLFFNEIDLLNKNNLNYLINLTSLNILNKNNFAINNYLNNNLTINNLNYKFKNNYNNFNFLFFYLNYSIIQNESFFLKDIFYLSLFK